MKIDFVGKKYYWFALSILVISIGVASMLIKGIQFGLEFSGGTLLDLSFEKKVQVSDIRNVLRDYNLADSVIQQTPDKKEEFLIRSKKLKSEEQKKIIDSLDAELKIAEVNNVISVGPGWGEQVSRGALLAMIASLIVILIYISFRFEYKMAICAITALAHDVLVVIGVYALVGRELNPNTIAAILTILGYSLYDTIVVFHRIKENVQIMGKKPFSEIVNKSINQVVMRSINTSLTSLIPVAAIILIGGDTLKDFAFALFIGIASGTYSSIFNASPILTIIKEREPYWKTRIA